MVGSRVLLVSALFSCLAVAPLSVSARQATPVPVDVGACTTEPRSNDEMRAQLQQRLPEIVSFASGTPRSDSVDRPPLDSGEPADPETVEAVTEVVYQYFACQNSGNLPATAAVLTEYGGGSFLGFGFLSFTQGIMGVELTPGAPINPQQIDLFLGAMQLQAPIPAQFRTTLYGVEDVRDLGDGHYSAITVVAIGDDEPARDRVLLIEEDGALHVTFGAEPGFTQGPPEATPVP